MIKIDITQTHDVDRAYQQVDFSNIRAKYHDPATQYASLLLIQAVYGSARGREPHCASIR